MISLDPQRQGLYKCVLPLGKTAARGDLFDHMHEGQPVREHETKTPWITFGLTWGGSQGRHTSP